MRHITGHPLIQARTGEEPPTTPSTSRRLDRIDCHNSGAKSLVGRYYSRQSHLHGDCFYSGMLDESEEIERRIRETINYITDAESLVDTDAA